MALSEALPARPNFSMPAFLQNRYAGAALIYLAATGVAELVSENLLESVVPNGPIGDNSFIDGLITGLIVGLFHVVLLSVQRSPYFRPWRWSEIASDFITIFVTVFVVETSLNILVFNQQVIQSEFWRQGLNSVTIGLLTAPVAIWAIWYSDCRREVASSGFATYRNPQLAIAAALIASVALLAALTVIVKVDRDRAWIGQARLAKVISLSGRQRMFSQRISAIALQAAGASIDTRAPLLTSLDAVASEMAEQASALQELVNATFDRRDARNSAMFLRLEQSSALRVSLLEQVHIARQALSIGDPIKPELILASESYLKLMEGAIARLERLAMAVTDGSSQSNSRLELLYPILLSVILFAVIAPVVRIFQSQYFGMRSASLRSAAALDRLRTYQTALDEHFSVVVTDREGRILEANKKFCHLSGYAEDELLGRSTKLLNSGNHTAEFFSEMWQRVTSGKIWNGEICNRAKDGTLYWVQAIIFPVCGDFGDIERFVSIRTDVTDVRRQANVLDVIVSNFPGGVALIDKGNQIAAYNRLYRQLLELPEDLFENEQPSLEPILRYNAERGEYGLGDPEVLVRERLDRVMDQREAVYEWVRPSGRALEIHRAPVEGGGYLTTYIDSTERKVAEASLQRAHAQLKAFVRHAPVSVAMVDNDLRYVSHTERWSKGFNLADDLVGQFHYDVFPDLPDRYKIMLGRCLGGAIESNDDDLFERADGTEHFLRWEVRPWWLSDGGIGGLIIMTEDISERKQIERSLWRAANIDGLTGLANRRQFRDSLSACIQVAAETDCGFALGIVDIDKFKEINDILGHDSGDVLLAEFAKRLMSAIGESNLVARLGGDEFAFILKGAKTEDDVRESLTGLFEAFAEPFDLNGSRRHCSFSCGVTMFPIDAKKATNLLKNADLALYCAKARGRGRYEVFHQDLRQSLDRSIRVRREISTALETDALCLYFQPVVKTDSRTISGVEALLRWRHPQQGILPPGAFLDAFEDPTLCAGIGARVMDIAVRQAGTWNRAGINFGYVAINVTSFDFSTGDFAERLDDLMAKCAVKPHQIMIEVTEGMFLGRGAETVRIGLERLNKLGVRIALDDFGTGYASLTHIKKFPIDCLKIDRSFVQDMETERHSLSIVKAVLQLARSLDLQVVAEGIETESQRRLLEVLGCRFIQGYLIAKPLPASEISDFVSQHTSGQPPLPNTSTEGKMGR